MKQFMILLIALLSILSQDTPLAFKPEIQHPIVMRQTQLMVEKVHYNRPKLSDELSSVIFDHYFNDLDYNRSYFLLQDKEQFEKYRLKIDDLILSGNLDPIYEIFNLFLKRFDERMLFLDKALNESFNFQSNEKFEYDRSNLPYSKTKEELDNFWRQRIRSDALNLRLAGKEDKDIRDLLKQRFDNIKRQMHQNKSEDIFQIFMNSYLEMIDPHTGYFSPRNADNFNMRMKLSLEGIGAQLRTENEYTIVAELVKGGPAEQGGILKKSDKIIAVGQNDTGDLVNVIGWRIDDVVELIRGKKGTVVRLEVIPVSAKSNSDTRIIRIVRDKIKLEEQAAKSSYQELNVGGKIYKLGIIHLPTFYLDFQAMYNKDPNYKSTTRDVKNLIEELQKKSINGLMIDLRDNGGGSLLEAIELTGLFIKSGPVVQVRDFNNQVSVEKDTDESIVYSGPMMVLINRNSASASEIFAGAIQDYQRGIIIGEQSYGKGTVQRMLDLAPYIRLNNAKIGQLKITTSKFYRINGATTQHMGVIPDLSYPSIFDEHNYGESSYKTALPYDQIEASTYSIYQSLKQYLPSLKIKFDDRISQSIDFNIIKNEIEEYKQNKDIKYIILNEKLRKDDELKEKQKALENENRKRKARGDKLLSSVDELKDIKKDEKDLYLDHSLLSLVDLIKLSEDKK